MKKTIHVINLLLAVCVSTSALAQPNFLAGSSKFSGLSSAVPSGSNMLVEKRISGNVASKCVVANADAAKAWFKFANGGTGWMPQWASCNYGEVKYCQVGHVYTACRSNDGGASDLAVDISGGRYYTFNVANTEDENKFTVLETLTEPVGIWNVVEKSGDVGEPAEISIELSSEKSDDEYLKLAYRSGGDNFTILETSKHGNYYKAYVPASVNVDGATVSYFVYTSNIKDLTPDDTDFDLLCLKQSKLFQYTIGDIAPEMPEAPVISAHRASLNSNDFTDFASLYISSYGGLSSNEKYTGAYVLEWQKSTDGGESWISFDDGKKNNTNNIRPVSAGDYRVVVKRRSLVTENYETTVSNVITVKDTGGPSKSIATNLPVVIVRTDVEDFPSGFDFLASNENLAAAKKKISVDVKIIWDEKSTDDVSNTYTGADRTNKGRLYYDSKARMNYRGSSSLSNERKNYAFVVGNDSCTSKGKWVKDKRNMFNLNKSKDKDFILYASASDNTYMRNMLSLNLYEDMTGEWNSHGRYVRLFINGEDKGLYIFMEKNKQSKDRIKTDADGYVFKFDKADIVDRATNADGDRSTFVTNLSGKKDISTYGLLVDQAFEIVYPEYDADEYTDDAWNQVVGALHSRISEFESYLSAGNYNRVRQLIDYGSWADNFIINEFTMNYDGFRISQYFKLNNLEDKIQASPLWDMELGLGNKIHDTGSFLYQMDYVAHEMSFPVPFWWNGYTSAGMHVGEGYGLMADDCFKAKVRQQWYRHTAEGGALSSGNVNAHLSNYYDAIHVDYHEITEWVNGRRVGLDGLISQFPNYIESVTLGEDKTVNYGDDITLRAEVKGNGSFNYKWYFLATGDDEWALLESGTNTLDITNVTAENSGKYKCVVEYSGCECVSDEAVVNLTVNTSTSVTDEPSSVYNVYASDRIIHISCPDQAEIVVSDAVGSIVSVGDNNVSVPCGGVYIVSVNGSVTKILVK